MTAFSFLHDYLSLIKVLFTTVHNQSINDNDTDTDNNNISAKLSYMKLCHEDS